MRPRAHRRGLVVWSSSATRTDRYLGLTRARPGRIRRWSRIVTVLAVVGLRRLAVAVRPRWQPLLAGTALTVTGFMLRSVMWGALALPIGFLLLYAALLIPGQPDEDRKRRSELERELAGYTSAAQRCDLEATLARYPDSVTYELRSILAHQAVAAWSNGIPGAGPP